MRFTALFPGEESPRELVAWTEAQENLSILEGYLR